jgi:hypothetical protein
MQGRPDNTEELVSCETTLVTDVRDSSFPKLSTPVRFPSPALVKAQRSAGCTRILRWIASHSTRIVARSLG